MIPYISAYLTGQAMVFYILLAWFYSSLPVHVWELLQKLGYRRADTSYWEGFDGSTMTWNDWSSWLAINEHPLLADLLSCKICLGFHIGWMVSLFCWILWPVSPLFIVSGTFMFPAVANIIFRRI